MTVFVRLTAEDLRTGARRPTTHGRFVFVAIDEQQVGPLTLEQVGETWVKALAAPLPPRVVEQHEAPCQEVVVLGDALDEVRKSEYRRLSGQDRSYIKGQKYTLLSHRENLTLEGKKSLKLLLAANKRLNTAYLLKETFGQLWDYKNEAWARRFFENWRASLKWQRLEPYEKFAEMIDRHWDGIAAYCKPENKVSLGFVEGLNNKIRVFQRRAYGLRDEEYLRLKVLSCMLPRL